MIFSTYKRITWAIVNLVNGSRGQTQDSYRTKILLKPSQRDQLIQAGELAVTQKLVLSTLGEISLRLNINQLAITTHRSHLGRLEEADFVICSTAGGQPAPLAPPHLTWHQLLYRETKADSVFFGYPPHALTLANTGRLPRPDVAKEIFAEIGGVARLRPDGLSNDRLADVARQHQAIVLPQLGALVWGRSPLDAVTRAEALDYISHLTLLAHQIGFLPDE